MFQMRVSDAVIALVEGMLPVGSNKGLHVILDLRLQEPETFNTVSATDLHFVFYRPSSYTKVWCAEFKSWSSPPPPESMVIKSDHDSCWRGDGVDSAISEIYFRDVNKAPKFAPVELKDYCHIQIAEYVDIAFETIDPMDTYRKRLTKIEKATTPNEVRNGR